MKTFNLLVLLSFLAFTTVSCSDESENITEPIVNGQVSEKILASVCTNWNSSTDYVKASMENYSIDYESNEILTFSNENVSHKICYEFTGNQLRTALISIPAESSENISGIYDMTGYKYMGNVDGAKIYTSSDKNTMGIIMNRNDEGKDYTVIGFTPLESDLFSKFEPIEITTLEADEISRDGFTMKATIAGLEENTLVYFELSQSLDMNQAKLYSVNSTNSIASKSVSNLTPNIDYYYRPYIIYDDIRYEGEIQRVELEKTPSYAIGDLYPSETNPEGVVVSIKDGGTHGTIISLDQNYLVWDVNAIFCTDYSAYNSSDGSKNNMGSSQPFAKWVNGHGTGWFGPARYQMHFSAANLKLINDGMRKAGVTTLHGFYWTSTQKDNNNAYAVTVTESSFMGYTNGSDFFAGKDDKRYVRAMKYF